MRRLLILLLVSAAAVVAAPSMASGGLEEENLDVQLEGTTEPLTFSATFPDGTCVEGDFEYLVEANGEEVTPIQAVQDTEINNPGDPDRFLFVLPSNTEPGELFIAMECDNGDGSAREQGSRLWASMPVTKVVSGPAPATATFTVRLDCEGEFEESTNGDFGPAFLPESFVVDFDYTVAGGVQYAYTDHGVLCTVTEPQNGGATSVSIAPQVIDSIPEPGLYPATVTNTFAAAIEPNFTG
jgi:hypothetical protein